MRKRMHIVAAALVGILSAMTFAQTVLAAGWYTQNGQWRYQDESGMDSAAKWEQIDGKWYYFDEKGWMAHDKTINPGYYVGSDGAWMPERDSLAYNHNVHARYETPCLRMHFETAEDYGTFWQAVATIYCWYDANGPIERAPQYDARIRVRKDALIRGYDSADAYFSAWKTGTANPAMQGQYLTGIRQDINGYVTEADTTACR